MSNPLKFVREQSNKSAFVISLVYIVAGILWILLSDHLVNALFSNSNLYTAIQTGKGWFYVLITGLLLWSFIRNSLRQKDKYILNQHAANQEIEHIHHELQHRVKNNLQLMLSLINLQEDEFRDYTQAQRALRGTYIRFEAISIAYEEMYSQKRTSEISLDRYVPRLIEDITQQYLDKSGEFCWDSEVSELIVSIDTIIPLGLIITELATAALEQKKEKEELVFNLRIKHQNGNLELAFFCLGCTNNFLKTNGIENLHSILLDELSSQLNGIVKITDDDVLKIQLHFPISL